MAFGQQHPNAPFRQLFITKNDDVYKSSYVFGCCRKRARVLLQRALADFAPIPLLIPGENQLEAVSHLFHR